MILYIYLETKINILNSSSNLNNIRLYYYAPLYTVLYSILKIIVLYSTLYSIVRVKNDYFHEGSVAQVVEYWIIVPKEGGSSSPGVFGDAAAEFAECDLA